MLFYTCSPVYNFILLQLLAIRIARAVVLTPPPHEPGCSHKHQKQHQAGPGITKGGNIHCAKPAVRAATDWKIALRNTSPGGRIGQ